MDNWIVFGDYGKGQGHRQRQWKDHFLWFPQQEDGRGRLGGQLDLLLLQLDELGVPIR